MKIEHVRPKQRERRVLFDLLYPTVVRLIQSSRFNAGGGVWMVRLKANAVSQRPHFAVMHPSSLCCSVSLPHSDQRGGRTVRFDVRPPLAELKVTMNEVARELEQVGRQLYSMAEEPSLAESWHGVAEFTLSPELMDLAVALALKARDDGFIARDDAYSVTREVRTGYRTAELHGVCRLIDPLCDRCILIPDHTGKELNGYWFTYEGRAIVGLFSSRRRDGVKSTTSWKGAFDEQYRALLDQRQKLGVLYRDFCALRIRMERILRDAGVPEEIRAQMSHRDSAGSRYIREQLRALDRQISEYERKKRS